MLRIITTLSLVSVFFVDGLEPETGSPKAYSTSFRQEDYTTNTPIYELKDTIIQYAPLDSKPTTTALLRSTFRDQLTLNAHNSHKLEQNILETGERKKYYHYLEPRMIGSKNSILPNKYVAYVHGHNMVVAPMYKHKFFTSKDIYQSYLEPVPSKKTSVPKIVLKHSESVTQEVVTEQDTVHLQHNTGFAPITQLRKVPDSSIFIKDYGKTEPLFPQLPPPRAPRLHLNIARVYGIAHIPHQALEPKVKTETIHTNPKPFIKLQPILGPADNTLLYPLKNFERDPFNSTR